MAEVTEARETVRRNIRPIETRYGGCLFRSRLEARWALFFDLVGIGWSYENDPVCIDGENYLPDFLLTIDGVQVVHEVKPLHERDRIKPPVVYLAGKMAPEHDWRAGASSLGSCALGERPRWNRRTVEWDGVRFLCNGPFSAGCGHKCTCNVEHDLHSVILPSYARDYISGAAIQSIATCDLFCGHISTFDAFGTLVEVGIARGYGRKICLTLDAGLCEQAARIATWHSDDDVHDLWFAEQMAVESARVSGFAGARSIHADFIRRNMSPEFRKISALGTCTGHAVISFGDPVDVAEKRSHYVFGQVSLHSICADHPEAAERARSERFGT